MSVEYRVLGPLEVLADGVAVPVPAGRCRVLLATLLLRPNRFVPADELVDRLWDGEPPTPDRAHKTLYQVVTRLRQALGPANCVQTSRGGYCAEISPSALDLTRFRSLVAAGDFAGAVGLWRGPMLSDVQSDALHQHDVAPVTEEWLLALERRVAADLEAGRSADLVGELRGLVAAHPLREAFWGHLMLALAQSGQQGQALAAYQQVRELLADELGVGPGADLQAVHERVLSGSVRTRGSAPRQLPTAVPRFVGRSGELHDLGELARGDGLVIAAITGTAGVGKTTLAVHWARGAADRFPDGQLYVNLRGFDRHREPMAPGDALSRFLEALGVAPERVPADLEAQAALYRSLVADRRMLVLLDNVRDPEHVRPLLPGPSASLVLITSRDRLTGLIVNEGAQSLALDVLSPAEARALLVSRLGARRVDAAADELIKWCGGLPLALAIVAARAAQSPSLPLSALVNELADERTRLDKFDTGDAATSVRTVFQWSYQQLSPVAARMFRLLGVHPGPDITVAAAASLAGRPAAGTQECLLELVRANLLQEHAPGRFTCHDLLRVYAADRAAADETAKSRAEVVDRMLDHYLHTLALVDRTYGFNHRLLADLPEPDQGVVPETFDDHQAAREWFRAEHSVLRGLVALADEQGLDRRGWQLTWFASDLVDRFGLWRDWIDDVGRAAQAAARLGERHQSAKLAFVQAAVCARLGRYEESVRQFQLTERLYEELGIVAGQVRCLSGIAWAMGELDRPHEALAVARKALEMQRRDVSATPDRIGMALHQVVFRLVAIGEYAEALDACVELEAVHGDDARPVSQALMWNVKARAHLGLGEYGRAAEELHRSLDLYDRMGSWDDVAITHELLGDAHHGLGDNVTARRRWTDALQAYDDHQHWDAGRVRAKLAALPEN